MSVKFRASVAYKPALGPSETPYQLYFFIGGMPGFVQSKKLKVLPGAIERPYLEFEIPVPKGVTPGEPFLPHHLALMVEAHCVATSPDEMHKPGVMAAGTALIPLRECLQTQHAGAVYKTQLIYQNMIDSNPGYDGYKGDLTVTFDQVDAPRGRNPFKAPDSQTIDHFAPEEVNPVIGATIEASIEFCATTPCRFDAKVVLPPFRFHKFLVPGQILGAKQCYQPIEESWWEKIVDCGVRRAHPDVPVEIAKTHLNALGTEQDFAEVIANAISAPCNYWLYFPDETDDAKKGMLTGEAFCLSSRSKSALVNGKFYVPGQDCEDCAKDMESLFRSFDKNVQLFKNPFLAKLQDYASNWVFLQSLCGVNGAQLSDGQATVGDPYANMGYHECGVLMHKGTFVKLVGKINKARPLFVGWADQFDPDAPLNETDRPMMLEGTGMVDPRGNGYRNQLLQPYRYLFLGNKSNHFAGWKMIQWQDTKKVNDFYRVFLQFVVPDLYDKGYTNASFVAMSKVNGSQWQRGFNYQELMTPHNNMGIRVEVGFTLEQSKMLQTVASFYPPVEPYIAAKPIEQCAVRSALATKVNKIKQTMAACNRSVRPGSMTLVADFYPAFHQLEDDRIDSICEMIKAKTRIVDVDVTEEPITEGLGGYAIAFHVDITPDEQIKLGKIANNRKLKHLPFVKLESHIDQLLK